MIEREFYRLGDLAARWGCTVDDLVHLGIQDQAQVCVNIYGLAVGSRQTRLYFDADENLPGPETEEEHREAEAHDVTFEQWAARTTKDMPHGVFELGHDELRFIDMPGAFPFELHEAMKYDRRGWWQVEFDPPVEIECLHLVMLAEEVARLDRDVFNKAAPEPVPATDLTTRERDTLLKIIYGMSRMPPFRFDPNAPRNGAAQAIADATEQAGCAVTDDTVRKWLKIAAAEHAKKPNSGNA